MLRYRTFGQGRPCCKRADLHRGGAVDVIAKSELAEVVHSPPPQRAVGFGGERMNITSSDRTPGGERAHLHRGGAADGIIATKAELAVVVAAPNPQRAVGFEGEGMKPASSDNAPGCERPHLYRGGA